MIWRGCMQVPRLQSVVRDRRANWEQSLATLRAAKAAGARITKTSIMLGCGETPSEVTAAMQELRDNGKSGAAGVPCIVICSASFWLSPIEVEQDANGLPSAPRLCWDTLTYQCVASPSVSAMLHLVTRELLQPSRGFC